MTLKLKEIRTIKGYSQQEVADHLGSTAVSYSRYESGNRSPSLEMLIKLADYFDVTIDYLLGRNTGVPQALSNYESSLVEAARKADDRAKEDAINILLAHHMC